MREEEEEEEEVEVMWIDLIISAIVTMSLCALAHLQNIAHRGIAVH